LPTGINEDPVGLEIEHHHPQRVEMLLADQIADGAS
jgi:hypothetical protein